jgi:hypothetical protein
MQPYFFPYLGHFGIIAHSDAWIVFDVTQYTPRSWINRNRILHPKQGWNYVSVPLANGSIAIRIHEARLLDPVAARKSVLGKLSHYRSEAPHYRAVLALVDEAFADGGDASLARLNVRGLAAVCRYLGLPFRARILSELDLALPGDLGPGDWAPAICARLGAKGYVNPAGGRALFDPAAFARQDIALHFAETEPMRYDTGRFAFEPDLSILDVLMWNPPERVADWLRTRTRLTEGSSA